MGGPGGARAVIQGATAALRCGNCLPSAEGAAPVPVLLLVDRGRRARPPWMSRIERGVNRGAVRAQSRFINIHRYEYSPA